MQFKKMAAVVSSTLAMSAGAHAQDAVQWRVEDGGNGHWYGLKTRSEGVDWDTARTLAEANGGHLASITSIGEDDICASISSNLAGWVNNIGPWLGGYQDVTRADFTEPSGGWRWITGEAWSYSAWADGEPNNCYCNCGNENFLGYKNFCCSGPGRIWNDLSSNVSPQSCVLPKSYIIEYSADCNSDGIVDYGQIRAGELVDANANNIPDCCEQGVSCDPCPGDIDESGTVNGVDLAAILAVWGSDGGKYPRADTNNDGEVNGADLATVLGSWGSCE